MAVETPLECSSCFTYILNTTDSARYEINEISGGAGDMTPCLMGGTAGVTREGVRFPDVLSKAAKPSAAILLFHRASCTCADNRGRCPARVYFFSWDG